MTHLIPELAQQQALECAHKPCLRSSAPELAPKPHSTCHPLCTAGCAQVLHPSPAMESPHPQLTTIPTRWELLPCNASPPCSLSAAGHSLVQMVLPIPSLPPNNFKKK